MEAGGEGEGFWGDWTDVGDLGGDGDHGRSVLVAIPARQQDQVT